jgi:hypothetical protein
LLADARRWKAGNRACARCKTKFLPNRADAEFCTAGCKQAAYRERKEEAAAELARQQAEDATATAEKLYRNRIWATRLFLKARTDCYWLRFMGTAHGVLAVEELQGEITRLPELLLCVSDILYVYRRETKDPDIVAILLDVGTADTDQTLAKSFMVPAH